MQNFRTLGALSPDPIANLWLRARQKSVILNLVFLKSINLNLKFKNKMNGSNPSPKRFLRFLIKLNLTAVHGEQRLQSLIGTDYLLVFFKILYAN